TPDLERSHRVHASPAVAYYPEAHRGEDKGTRRAPGPARSGQPVVSSVPPRRTMPAPEAPPAGRARGGGGWSRRRGRLVAEVAAFLRRFDERAGFGSTPSGGRGRGARLRSGREPDCRLRPGLVERGDRYRRWARRYDVRMVDGGLGCRPVTVAAIGG